MKFRKNIPETINCNIDKNSCTDKKKGTYELFPDQINKKGGLDVMYLIYSWVPQIDFYVSLRIVLNVDFKEYSFFFKKKIVLFKKYLLLRLSTDFVVW